MSEVRLVIRDAEKDIHGTCHGSEADLAIAALSADPETLDELFAAMKRFARTESGRFGWFSPGVVDEPYDAGVVIVDLAARLVACESTYSSPGPTGAIAYHDGHCATEHYLPYHLADDWRFTSDMESWRHIADDRRRQRAAQPPLDVRAILYGKPLLKLIAGECWRAFENAAKAHVDKQPVEEDRREIDLALADEYRDPHSSQEHDLIKEIHARWLLTAREDLAGQAPRNVLLAQRDHINWELQDREQQWSMLGACPRGLDLESHAFRFAGFGTHEFVKYYELVRHLLWSCWDGLNEPAGPGQPRRWPEAMTAGDFQATEVPRLERVRDQWFAEPDPECHGITPREIIDRERARLPQGMSAHEAMIDDDCPLCQMLADMPGPMFWHLDGCNMDWDFAFSSHRTREEWEEEQREHEEFSRRMDAKHEEEKRLGVKYPGSGYADPDWEWKRSFAASDSPGLPLEIRLLSVGANLAELVVDLKRPPEERPLIDRLSRDFGNLRDVTRSTDPARAEALIEPVLDQFRETLAAVAQTHVDLAPKCEDLSERLEQFLEPPADPADMPEFGDDDLPF